jgi:hypothetical protein
MQTWMYLVVPVLLYASERASTLINESNHHVNIVKVSTINIMSTSILIEENESNSSYFLDMAGNNLHGKCFSTIHEQTFRIQV